MAIANADYINLAWICLVCWGIWPTLRQKCGAPVAAFAPLNICAQFSLGLVCLVLFDDVVEMAQTLLRQPSLYQLAVVAGGFALGHGDNLAAMSMSYLPASVAYPVYAGSGGILGNVLLYSQVTLPEADIAKLVFGIALVLSGLVFLTLANSAKETAMARDSSAPQLEEGLLQAASPAPKPAAAAGRVGATGLSTSAALLACVLASASGNLWPGCVAFAHSGGDAVVEAPIRCLVLFQLGLVLAIPSIVGIGGYATGTGVLGPLRQLDARSAAWGVLCGVSVGTGWAAFMTMAEHVSTGIAAPIIGCNPLISNVITLARGDFDGAPRKAKIFVAVSMVLYASAIAVLSSLAG